MKTNYLILITCFIINSSVFAQNPINVQITGDCSGVQGVYNYVGTLNGKNQYLKTFIVDSVPVNIYIHFNGTIWILNSGENIADNLLFVNTSNTTSIIPPITNWQLGNCPNGTMSLTEMLSISQFNENNISIYPNPTSEFLIVENAKKKTEHFEFKIFDLIGRIVLENISIYNQKINISNLTSGQYIIEIKDIAGTKLIKKIIKK